MSQLVAALFETHAQAEEALTALVGAGVARDSIQIIGEDEDRGGAGLSEVRESPGGTACAAALRRLRLPEEDASAFEAACGGGGAVLAVTVEESGMDEAIGVIETFDPIDLDSRTEERRASAEGGAAATDAATPLAAGLSGGGMGGQTNTGALPGMGALTDGAGDVGSGDLRTREVGLSDMGLSSTATGARRADERAGAPGTLELGARPDAGTATKQAPPAEQTAGLGLDAKPDPFRRETSRVGRVRAYVNG